MEYSRVQNKHTPTFINFWNFFQGLWYYYELKRLKFYYISLQIFKGLCLFFLSNFPVATFIHGATSIPDSKVRSYCRNLLSYQRYKIKLRLTLFNCEFSWSSKEDLGYCSSKCFFNIPVTRKVMTN